MGFKRKALLLGTSVGVVSWLGIAGAGLALQPPAPTSLSVGVDSVPSDRALESSRGITIHNSARSARRKPIVAYSVRLGHFDPPERVSLGGAVAPSYCVGSDIDGTDRAVSPCRKLAKDHIPNPHYKIEIEARLYSARSSSDPGSPSQEPLARARVTCTFARHHCPLTLRSDTVLKKRPGRFANLELSAWTHSSDWHRPDRMDLDCFATAGRCQTTPTNSIDPDDPSRLVQTHGRLGVIRYGERYATNGREGPVSASSNRVDDADVVVNPPSFAQGTVVHSARLEGLQAGDVIEASGSTELTGQAYDHFGGGYWVLAGDPTTRVAQAGTTDRYLSAFNGVNCLGESDMLTGTTSGYCSSLRDPPTLPLAQAGFGKVPADAPSTMYLNFVVIASDLSYPPGATPTAHADSVTTDVGCDPVQRALGSPSCAITVP